jgi:hypothetical protein
MRALPYLTVFLALAACDSSGETEDTDAGGPVDDGVLDFEDLVNVTTEGVGDFTCYTTGDPWIEQNVDPAKQVTSAGNIRIVDFQEDDPVPEASVSFWFGDDVSATPDATGISDADGVVSVDVPACTPLSYLTYTNPDLEATRDTFEAHQVFEPPAVDTIEADINSVSRTTYQLIPSILGVSPATDKGVIAGTAYDCAGAPVKNAQIVVRDAEGNIPQSLIVKYFVDDFPNRDQPTTSADGLWVAINVPEGTWYVDMYAVRDGAVSLLGTTVVQSFAQSINISNVHTGVGDGVKYPESCLLAPAE